VRGDALPAFEGDADQQDTFGGGGGLWSLHRSDDGNIGPCGFRPSVPELRESSFLLGIIRSGVGCRESRQFADQLRNDRVTNSRAAV